jgi:nicotinamide mononucleotide transporter
VSLFELVAALITIVSIWLATKESLWYYPTGIISVLMYGWVYYDARLYAESFLQLCWLVLLIYGWNQWMFGGRGQTVLAVTRTSRWAWLAAVSSGLAISAITVWVQLRYTDNPAPYVDSSLMAWSLVAQWMTARKWIESWILWLLINTVAVPLYVARDLLPTAALFAGLWVLAIVGYRSWRRTLVSA